MKDKLSIGALVLLLVGNKTVVAMLVALDQMLVGQADQEWQRPARIFRRQLLGARLPANFRARKIDVWIALQELQDLILFVADEHAPA